MPEKHYKWFVIFITIIVLLPAATFSQDTLTKKQWRKLQKNFLLKHKHWTVEAPLWIPRFAGTFAYGDVDIEGEDGVDLNHRLGGLLVIL